MRKVSFVFLILLSSISLLGQDVYVDLGLPSGTLWKANNEKSIYYTYNEAASQFGDNLPTLAHFEELKTFCIN